MATIDVFFTDEDAHKVRPLLHFLDLQDLKLCEHDHAIDAPSSPYLVIVSEHAPSTQWLKPLIASEDSICVLISDAEIPPQTRALDLRTWPARSADRTLASFAEWMRAPSSSAQPSWANASQKQAASQTSETQNLGVVVALVGVFAVLLWLSYNQSAETTEAAQQIEEAVASPRNISADGLSTPTSEEAFQREVAPGSANLSPSPTQVGTSFGATTTYPHAPTQLDLQSAISHRSCTRQWSLNGRIQQCWEPLKGPVSWLTTLAPPAA